MKFDFYEGLDDFISAYYLFSFALRSLNRDIDYIHDILDDENYSEDQKLNYSEVLSRHLDFQKKIKSKLENMMPVKGGR